MPAVRLPETDLARIERYCRARVPEHALAQVRCEWHRHGKTVTICEARAPWDGQGDWTHSQVAQLHYRPDAGDWSLHWRDRNTTWHPYDSTGAHLVGPVSLLLDEVERDPTSIFWG